MRKRAKKVDLLSVNYKNKIQCAGEWCKKNKDKYPTNWQVELKDKANPHLTHIVFSKCGLCFLCKSEGVPEIISSLCATDNLSDLKSSFLTVIGCLKESSDECRN